MARASFGVALGLSLALGACSDDDGGPSQEPPHPCFAASENACAPTAEPERGACIATALRECSTNHYLRNWPAHPLESCVPGSSIVPLDADVTVRLFHGGGARDEAVVEQTQGLQRYFAPHNLWFFADVPSEKTTLSYAMAGTQSQILAALKNAGIPTNQPLSPEQEAAANQIVGGIVFAPLRSFISLKGSPPASLVNVVVLAQVISPELEQLLGMPLEIAGLGLSPTLLATVGAEDPQSDLYELLGLPASFTPTLFVASGVIRKYTQHPDNIVSHEMGHALGLVHTQWYGNLMTQGSPFDCRTVLEPDQADAVTLPHVVSPIPGYRLLFELRRRVLDRVLPLR